VIWSVPDDRPKPRSIRPGCSSSSSQSRGRRGDGARPRSRDVTSRVRWSAELVNRVGGGRHAVRKVTRPGEPAYELSWGLDAQRLLLGFGADDVHTQHRVRLCQARAEPRWLELPRYVARLICAAVGFKNAAKQ
jgi:hypothetical protein